MKLISRYAIPGISGTFEIKYWEGWETDDAGIKILPGYQAGRRPQFDFETNKYSKIELVIEEIKKSVIELLNIKEKNIKEKLVKTRNIKEKVETEGLKKFII